MDAIVRLNREITGCRRCPRLVRHREWTAGHPPRRHALERYWGKPLPGFGDPNARIYILGLAPAANGGNRTGRVFTGDRSGDWLFAALHAHGLASRANSISIDDGMQLSGAYIGAAVRCAPPHNKPTLAEFDNCRPYAARELDLLTKVRVFVPLGSIAYATLRKLLRPRLDRPFRFPSFGHGVYIELPDHRHVLCSYHPSQQNTFTGKLTREMFRTVFARAKRLAFPE
jgi:uracil-DNA glycosylase family 4